jgi:hypothetical protein
MILKEIGKLGMKIVNGDNNEIIITPEDFKRFWKKVNEFTSSSMSGVHYHYGHYKAAIQDPQSTNVLVLQLTIIARSGIPPESWSVGLLVMLEKIAGVCLVEKLRAIHVGRRVPVRQLAINIQLECRSNRSPEGISGDLEVCSAIKPFLLLVLLVKLQSYDVWIAGKIIAQT